MKPLDADQLQQMLRAVREELPTQLELATLASQIMRARFNAYVKEGFTEAQAIELCKGPMFPWTEIERLLKRGIISPNEARKMEGIP